ncbi:MAG: PKD domain-containing protein, partial [Acinetobacter sp.]|nr:PKD domain-containing protein [Acinetobacter sp.]
LDTAPIVSITPASITINEGANGTLIGNAQAQSQKSIQRVQWEALATNSLVISIDGASDENTVNFTAPQVDQDQILQLRFTAIDSAGESRSAIANVLVKNVLANQLPQARAGNNQRITPPGSVSLNGCNSSDPDGQITAFLWQRLNEQGQVLQDEGDTCQIDIVYDPVPATRIDFFRLTVTDNQGASNIDEVQVLVEAGPNTAPRITSAQANPQPARPGESVLLSAIAEDTEGHPIDYRWTQKDGTQVGILFANSSNAEVQLTEPGEYEFVIQVRDAGTSVEQADKRSVKVRVEPAPKSREPGLSECILNPFARGCILSPLNRLLAGETYSACLSDPTKEPCLLAQLARGELALLPAVDSAGTCTPKDGANYSHFWGSWHNHTAYSDGAPFTRPADVFRQVKERGFDFATTTDHSDNARLPIALPDSSCIEGNPLGCLLSDPERLTDNFRKWGATFEQAKAETTSNFTALRGFEWTSDRFGHANVLFSRNVVNAKTGPGYLVSMDLFWQWFMYPARLGGGNDGILVFNHPGREDAIHGPLESIGLGDPAYTFNDFRYIPGADYRVVGVEVFGKGDEYDTEGMGGSWLGYALDKGWYLAPFGSEDHHDRDWGSARLPKTVAIARTRSSEDIQEALLARRVYAVAQNFNDVRLDFFAEHSGQKSPMGSRVNTANNKVSLQYSVGTRPGKVNPLSKGVVVELMSSTANNDVQYSPLLSNTANQGSFEVTNTDNNEWYFLRVRNRDDNKVVAVSAPIWLRQGSTPLGDCPAL